MVTYCQAGDTARVTLPDGSIQDFSDTPITIDFTRSYSEAIVNFNVNSGAFSYNSPSGLEVYNFISSGAMKFAPQHPTVDGWWSWKEVISDIGNYGEDSTNIAANFPGWKIDDYYRNKLGMLPKNSIYQTWDTNYLDNSGTITIKFFLRSIEGILIVTGNSGNILFNQSYSTDNYTVECIQGCPPNTLDCGDCCLDCNLIFNSISDIRRLILTIR